MLLKTKDTLPAISLGSPHWKSALCLVATLALSGCETMGTGEPGGIGEWIAKARGKLSSVFSPDVPDEQLSESEKDMRQSSEQYVNNLVLRASIEQAVLTGAVVAGLCAINERSCWDSVIALALVTAVDNYIKTKNTAEREGEIAAAEAIAADAKAEVGRLQQAANDAENVAQQNSLEIDVLQKKINNNQLSTAQAQAEAERFEANAQRVGATLEKGKEELEAWESTLEQVQSSGKDSTELEEQIAQKRSAVKRLESIYASMQQKLESFDVDNTG